MKAFVLILALISFLGFNVKSQDVIEEDDSEELQTEAILKFSPLSLLDIYSAIQMAVELKVAPQSTYQLEAGYIFPFPRTDADYDEYNGMNGFRLRTEYRYFLKMNRFQTGGLYVGPEVFFLKVNFDRSTVEYINESGFSDQDYYMKMDYEVDKKVLGYHAKVGYQRLIGKKIILDIYAGVGARHVWIDTNKPGSENDRRILYEDNYFYSTYDKGIFYRPSIALGFKIGLLLK